jgi:hypothetical protein
MLPSKITPVPEANIETLILTDVDVKCFFCSSRKPLMDIESVVNNKNKFTVILFDLCNRCISILSISPEWC